MEECADPIEDFLLQPRFERYGTSPPFDLKDFHGILSLLDHAALVVHVSCVGAVVARQFVDPPVEPLLPENRSQDETLPRLLVQLIGGHEGGGELNIKLQMGKQVHKRYTHIFVINRV